ncbi:adhesion G protein-coupled receptor F4 isoform 2-T2 [Syngnathus typhle]
MSLGLSIRNTMFSIMFVMGSLFMYYQACAADSSDSAAAKYCQGLDTKGKEVVVVHDGQKQTVVGCLIYNGKYLCNCSNGCTRTNEPCCCSERICKNKVMKSTTVCLPNVQDKLTGTSKLNGTMWDLNKIKQLETAFQELHGFQHLNITGLSLSNRSLDFEVGLNNKFATSRLQGIVSTLEANLGANFRITLSDNVTIESTETCVPYMSEATLKCTLEGVSKKSSWKIIRRNEYFELNNGSVVKLDSKCATNKSCTAVTLHNVTNIWAGTYECEFTSGSLRHTARKELKVATLPEDIAMTAEPVTVDCSKKQSTQNVTVTATVQNNNETYKVMWSYKVGDKIQSPTADSLDYNFTAVISCQETSEAHYVTVTFKNIKDQEKSARLDIPVIYVGKKFCKEDDLWPRTPDGDTVFNRKCPKGRVGYESRTCKGNKWQPVFSNCVSNHLFTILQVAENYMKGQGATPKRAKSIFEGLRDSSMSDSNSIDKMTDLTVSIHILELMAKASEINTLDNCVLQVFVDAASNMLAQTWAGVNESIIYNLSSNYLWSVEGLVKNIQINQGQRLTSPNLEVTVCPGGNCEVTSYNTTIYMNRSSGILKILAVKNLTDKLQNDFPYTVPSPVLISATLEDNDESSVRIRLKFNKDLQNSGKTFCVFWNTTGRWSEEGCRAMVSGNDIFCECDHLTPFSAMFGYDSDSTQPLEHLTIVGLSVSICSLLIFLIIQCLVWSAVVKTNLSHFYHTAMVNIAVFLLLGHCSFLISSLTTDLSTHPPWCEIATVCKHLFFLATFCWMLCMSVMLVYHLIFVFNPLSKNIFISLSSIVGYVFPMLIVGSTYMYCKYSGKRYHDEKCWLVSGKVLQSSLSSFLFPIGAITLINLCCVVVVIVTLVKSPVLDSRNADYRQTAKRILKVIVFLTPVFGLTWIVGFFLFTADLEGPFFVIVNYTFSILNSFQGLSILLSGCFAEQKVRGELLKLIMVNSKGKLTIKHQRHAGKKI